MSSKNFHGTFEVVSFFVMGASSNPIGISMDPYGGAYDLIDFFFWCDHVD